MSNESKIHIKNIKVLMTEIYEFLNYLSLPIMNDIFQKQEKPKVPSFQTKIHYYCCGVDTISLSRSSSRH